MDDLKPCPFCGGSAEIERRGTASRSMQIACTYCGARVESGDVFGLTHISEWRWNRRADALAEMLPFVEMVAGQEIPDGWSDTEPLMGYPFIKPPHVRAARALLARIRGEAG